MNEDLKYKYNLMLRIDRYERALVELSSWKPGVKLSKSTLELTKEINSEEARDNAIAILEDFCKRGDEEKDSNDGKLYLTEIIEKEKPNFKSNNLILAPTGSGKTHFMKSLINSKEVLLLVSTTSLKDKFVPNDESERERLSNRMYSTKRREVYGEEDYKILVMTYAELGERIKFTNDFVDKYTQIFCDEIHSLFNYYSMSSKDTLLGAIKYLFERKENQVKYYFTATDEHLSKFKLKSSKLFKDVKIFNYLEHDNIVRHLVLSEYRINNLEQVRPHLIAKKNLYKYFKYKVFAFCKTINNQKYLSEILKREGFNPLVLWSINNKEFNMTDEQLKQREYVLRTGLIPDGYDALIVNSSMQEGWDLLDPKVRLAIINTTNKTEYIQSIGRIRRNVDVLVYRVDSEDVDHFIEFPNELINIPLTTAMKRNICEELGLKNQNGRLLKWPSIAKILEKQGFILENKNITKNGKTARVTTVNYVKVVQ